MIDWGLFKLIDGYETQPPARQGIDLLNSSHMLTPTGGAFRMARTLGSEDPNQVSHLGRRVALGWISFQSGDGPRGKAVNGMSLPRDLSLERISERGSREREKVVLLQSFAPELKVLRQNLTTFEWRHEDGVARRSGVLARGQVLEIYARFEISERRGNNQDHTKSDSDRNRSFGLVVLGEPGGRDQVEEGTVIRVDPVRRLICVNGTAQGNADVRCGPLELQKKRGVHRNVIMVHAFLDHGIIELIVNNRTALTASVVPSSAKAAGVWAWANGDQKVVLSASVWDLAPAVGQLDSMG